MKSLFSALLLEGFLELWNIQGWCRKFGAGIAIAGHRDRALRISYCGRIGLNDRLFCLLPEDCNEKSRQPSLDHSAGFGPVPIFRGRRKRTVIQGTSAEHPGSTLLFAGFSPSFCLWNLDYGPCTCPSAPLHVSERTGNREEPEKGRVAISFHASGYAISDAHTK